MMGLGHDARDRSFPELLAAYADGELDPAGRARVEAWLADHPDARDALTGQQRLSRHNRKLWKASAPLSPSEGSWARVFGRVQDVLDAPVRPARSAPPRSRRWLRRAVAVLSTAAAAAVALYLTNPGPAPVTLPGPPPAVEPLAAATDADIDIISLDDRDAAALVVGKPPLSGTVVLAAHGDVTLKGLQKADDGMLPKAPMNDPGAAPMIIAPLAGR
jgi:hypothetical protein